MTATPIAVTGLACRFPGATDAAAFWSLLDDGREGLTRFTDDQLAARGVPRWMRRHPDYVPVGGLITGQDLFDPQPFGLTDGEAALMDPQQRLFLECAWQALEQAGHGGGRGAGAVGVFAGAMQSSYLVSNLLDRWDPTGGGADPIGSLQTAIATQVDYLPLQVAYRLNLTGPALSVNTTCSTSLVAVHAAVQSLLMDECDTALAGGASLTVPQGRGYLHIAEGIFSRDGRVRPFSARGSGIVYTQGVGVVVLRRLDDALSDGDPVLAVVHGSAVNNDGADKAGFTAPSVRGQARVIAEALAVAGLTPHDIGHVEAHGTGTQLGDPIETAALRQVFGVGPAWCGLGSVKSNIGHTNSAAGIASFIKTVLAIQHRRLPASLHAEPLNDHLALGGSPFDVVTTTRHWDTPPHAGVSSFGIGGTNAHVVLGPPSHRVEPPVDGRPQVLVVSAHSRVAAERTAEVLADHAERPVGSVADLAHTLQHGREHFTYRLAAVTTADDMAGALRAAVPVEAASTPPRVVFAFPGGGSQYPGMGATLYASEQRFADCIDECAAAFTPLLGEDIRDLITGDCGSVDIRHRAWVAASGLPALFTVSLATARLLLSWGVRPDVVVGHSLGEYAAAVTCGALTVADAARLVAVRSQGLSRCAGGGGLLAVPADVADVNDVLAAHPDVDLAVVNAPDAYVLSGRDNALDAVAAELRLRGIEAVRLHLDGAAHSRLVDPVLPDLRHAATGLPAATPVLPMISTLTGCAVAAELGDAEYWVRQLREPVRFPDALLTALPPDRPAVLVQTGPGSTLAALARRHGLASLRATVTTFAADDSGQDLAAARSALGQLWVHGVDVDFSALHPVARRRVPLPGYAFQRRRLWIDPPARKATSGEAPDPDEPLQVPMWRQVPPAGRPAALTGRWLVCEAADELSAALRAAGAEPVSAEDLLAGDGAGDDGAADVVGVVVVVDIAADRAEDPDAVTDQVLAHAEVAAALVRLARPPTVLLQVTRGAERVQGGDRPVPAAVAVRALPRVIGQETPGLRWRTLDLDGHGAACAVGPVVLTELGELLDSAFTPRSGVEVAVRDSVRLVREVVSWRPTVPVVSAPSPSVTPPAGGRPVAVIIGGLGEVGLTMAAHLAEEGMRIVITSRTGVPDRPAAGSRDAERAAALRSFVDRDLPVEVRRLDAADRQATAALLAELAAANTVDLVVHAAGVVATAALEPMRAVGREHVHDHVRAKVAGALALRAAVDELPAGRRPRTVLLMSSAGTLVGGIGMGPYSASNGFLDALAAAAGAGETRWLSVVWDAWKVDHLGTDREVYLDFALDAATGMAALDRLLVAAADGVAPPVVAVSTTDLRQRMADAAGPRPAASTDPVAGATDDGDEQLTGAAAVLAGLWSELFGVPVVRADADFFALGGHSLLATRMLGVLRHRFGVELGLRDLLAAPTVGGLAALITAGTAAPPVAAVPVVPHRVPAVPMVEDGTFPMTRVQHAYWVGRGGGYELGDIACHFYLEYDCADLDLDRYERAWNTVLARHPMLRAIITAQGRIKVLDHVPRYRIRVHDLTSVSEPRRAERLLRLRERVSHQPGPSDRWPLVQIQAATLPTGRVRLFIGVDVLVCDAASWWIVNRELHHFYHHPEVPLPEPAVRFADCVPAVDGERGGPEFERAAAYWRARLDTLPGPPALPLGDPGQRPRFVRRAARLDRDEWAALCDRAAASGLTRTAVLLAAYSEVIAAWSGDDRFALTITLFDRPAGHSQLDAVVGDFTSLLLHEADHTTRRSFAELADATQRRLFTDLDHRAFSALDVLAERSSRHGRVEPVPVVFTSALGLEDVVGGERDLQWVGEQVYALSQTPQTWLDHQVLVQRGELVLQWDAVEPLLPAAELDRVFATYVARLRALATDPAAWTASPVPEVDQEDILLPLRSGTGGRELFLVHPSGGDVLCYAELSRHLDERVEVVAVTDPELVGGPAPPGVSALADLYVRLIRRRRPHGPYLLGGWSMGGSLGQEMACRLHDLGERVELLLMFDSNDPTYITPVDRSTGDAVDAELLVRHLAALEGYLAVDLGVGTPEESAALAALPPQRRRAEAEGRLRRHHLLGRGSDLGDRLAVFGRHLRALAAHRPRRLDAMDTATLLVRADQVSPRNSGIGMGVDDTPPGLPDLGWGRHLARPPEVVGMDADHYSLLRPPAVHRLAEAVNAVLVNDILVGGR